MDIIDQVLHKQVFAINSTEAQGKGLFCTQASSSPEAAHFSSSCLLSPAPAAKHPLSIDHDIKQTWTSAQGSKQYCHPILHQGGELYSKAQYRSCSFGAG